jgi:hypothetical protein
MKPGTRTIAALGLLMSVSGGAACAQILGADFDVHGTGSGGAGGGTTTSSSTTTGSTNTSATTTGSAGGGGAGAGGSGGAAPTCDGGPCPEVIADHLDLPWGIALHGAHVYWTVAGKMEGEGKVMRAPVAGGPAELLASGLSSPDQLFVDDQHAYWTRNMVDGAVERIPVDGSESVEVIADGLVSPIGITGDAEKIHFSTSDGYVKSHPLAAGLPGSSVILSKQHPSPSVLVLSGGGIFFAEYSVGGGVFRLDLATHDEQTLAMGQTTPNAVVVSDKVYFTTTKVGGAVNRVDIPGEAPTQFAPDQNQPAGIAADELYIYWANFGDGTIRRLKKGGGTPEILASGQRSPNGIVVDDEAIYWTNFELDAAVMKLAK